MKQLIEVIKLVADKYMDNTSLILADNYLTLEYLIDRTDGEKDVYKTLKIEEFDGMLKITPYPEKVELFKKVEDIDEIIEILEKQSKTRKYSKEELKYIRNKYTVGTKVKLIRMYDLIGAVPPNTTGTISYVDDIGTIHIEWENGSSLGLNFEIDEFIILNERSSASGEDK